MNPQLLALLKVAWDRFEKMPSSQVVLILFAVYFLWGKFENMGVTTQDFLRNITSNQEVLDRIEAAETNIIAHVVAQENKEPVK